MNHTSCPPRQRKQPASIYAPLLHAKTRSAGGQRTDLTHSFRHRYDTPGRSPPRRRTAPPCGTAPSAVPSTVRFVAELPAEESDRQTREGLPQPGSTCPSVNLSIRRRDYRTPSSSRACRPPRLRAPGAALKILKRRGATSPKESLASTANTRLHHPDPVPHLAPPPREPYRPAAAGNTEGIYPEQALDNVQKTLRRPKIGYQHEQLLLTMTQI